MQFIGDVSYGVYLWHWPLIVLITFATKRSLSVPLAIVALFASIVLGWASKKFVEDPVRRSRFLASARPRRTFIAVGLATVILAVTVTPLATHQISAPRHVSTAEQSACYGARSVFDAACGDPGAVPLVAPLSSFALDLPPTQILGCENSVASGDVRRCDYGESSASGPHVALVGDSHATRLVEPLQEVVVGERSGRLSTFTVSGCAMVSGELTGSAWGFDPAYAGQCQAITAHTLQTVAEDPGIDTVVLTNRTRLYVSDHAAFHPLTAQMVEATIHKLTSAGKRVIVIKDPPETHATAERGAPGAVDCLLAASSAVDCSLPRAQAMFDDPLSKAAANTATPVVDLDDIFCTADRCRQQIGGLVVYSDDSHLSRSFASSLTPMVSKRLDAAGLPRGR